MVRMGIRFWSLLLGAALVMQSAQAGFGLQQSERRTAANFIVEKLRLRQGETWERLGSHFLWSYDFDQQGCTLNVLREDVQGGNRLRQRVPIAATVPIWRGSAKLELQCSLGEPCISYRQLVERELFEGSLRKTELPVPEPSDLPKLLDAFVELNRLCDDRYRD